MKYKYILKLILIFVISATSAAEYKKDSLLTVWEDQTKDKLERVKALNKYAYSQLFENPDSAHFYAKTAMKFAQDNKFESIEVNSLSTMGLSEYLKSDFDKAIEYQLQATAKAEKLKESELIIKSNNNLGLFYERKSRYKEALECYFKSVKTIERNLKPKDSIANYNNFSMVYSNIGLVYDRLQKYDKALEYHQKSLEYAIRTNDLRGISSSYGNIGLIIEAQHKFREAIEYQRKALKIRIEIGYDYGMAQSYGSIGTNYEALQVYDSAIYYYDKSIKILKEIGERQLYAISIGSKASTLIRLKKYTEAEKLLKEAVAIFYEIGDINYESEYQQKLYELYKNMNNTALALKHFERYNYLHDSLYKDENRKMIIEKEFEYEYSKKSYSDSLQTSFKEKLLQSELSAHKNQRTALFVGLLLVVVFAGFMYNRFKVTQKQNVIIEKQKTEVEQQKHLVDIKNLEITQSIQYAQKIQAALLPSEEIFRSILSDSFILFNPKDIVSGDYYWISDKERYTFYVTADCTGHGVPGGFMSMLGTALLNEIIDERKIDNCGEVLTLMREKIMQALKQAGDSESKDGMDMVLIRIDKQTLEMQYAAANNSFYVIRHCEDDRTKQSVHADGLLHSVRNDVLQTADCQLFELPCDKMPVGVYHSEVKPFKTYTHQLQKGDIIYTYTDGYADQFGGDLSTGSRVKKYTYRRLREKLLAISQEPLAKQKDILQNQFENWKGDNEQIDDVCLIGVKI